MHWKNSDLIGLHRKSNRIQRKIRHSVKISRSSREAAI